MATIREFRPEDRAAVEACMAELQDHERRIDPWMLAGREMAGPYVAILVDRCRESDGRIFVAEADAGRVVGFLCVYPESEAPQYPPETAVFAWVSDLSVLPSHRGTGLGRALLEAAEGYAREKGFRSMRLCVLAENRRAIEVYRAFGLEEYELILRKPLAGG